MKTATKSNATGVEVRTRPGQKPAARSRAAGSSLEFETHGEEQAEGPGYYLMLLRQHHTTSRRRWYRRLFAMGE